MTISSEAALTAVRVTIDNDPAQNVPFVGAIPVYFATYEVTTPLTDGIHGLTLEAFNSAGEARTMEVFPLYVQNQSSVIAQGAPLAYPNPFIPGSENVKLTYSLSKPANISLSIYDVAGNLLVKKSLAAGGDGGRSGYNEVVWDGKSDSGGYVGNGIYLYFLVADGKIIQNGKGKVTAFR